MQNSERQDIYTRITAKIVASLEQGVRPWMKPWSGENTAARITRPLRHNGTPYSGINILMLWGASIEHGFTSPSWMTFKQALELNAHVRKGEKGSLVVYANTFSRTEEDADVAVSTVPPHLPGRDRPRPLGLVTLARSGPHGDGPSAKSGAGRGETAQFPQFRARSPKALGPEADEESECRFSRSEAS
jgi:hypothetical protein